MWVTPVIYTSTSKSKKDTFGNVEPARMKNEKLKKGVCVVLRIK